VVGWGGSLFRISKNFTKTRSIYSNIKRKKEAKPKKEAIQQRSTGEPRMDVKVHQNPASYWHFLQHKSVIIHLNHVKTQLHKHYGPFFTAYCIDFCCQTTVKSLTLFFLQIKCKLKNLWRLLRLATITVLHQSSIVFQNCTPKRIL